MRKVVIMSCLLYFYWQNIIPYYSISIFNKTEINQEYKINYGNNICNLFGRLMNQSEGKLIRGASVNVNSTCSPISIDIITRGKTSMWGPVKVKTETKKFPIGYDSWQVVIDFKNITIMPLEKTE